MANVKSGPVKVTATKAKERTFFEPNEWYKATLESAEIGKGTYGPYVKFNFKIVDGKLEDGGDAAGKPINALMSMELAPGTKLWEWTTALFGREPEIDEEVDFSAFYGCKYRVLIEDRKNKKDPDSRYQHVKILKKIVKKPK